MSPFQAFFFIGKGYHHSVFCRFLFRNFFCLHPEVVSFWSCVIGWYLPLRKGWLSAFCYILDRFIFVLFAHSCRFYITSVFSADPSQIVENVSAPCQLGAIYASHYVFFRFIHQKHKNRVRVLTECNKMTFSFIGLNLILEYKVCLAENAVFCSLCLFYVERLKAWPFLVMGKHILNCMDTNFDSWQSNHGRW